MTENSVRGIVCIGTTFVITQGEEKKVLIFPVQNDGNGVLRGGILLPRCVILRINAYTAGGTGVDLGEMQPACQGKQGAA